MAVAGWLRSMAGSRWKISVKKGAACDKVNVPEAAKTELEPMQQWKKQIEVEQETAATMTGVTTMALTTMSFESPTSK